MSPAGPRLKILLSEGSSLSARHTVTALGPAGHTLDLFDPQPFCLARFSRYAHAWYRSPPFAADPLGYLQCLEELLRVGQYDVLLPVHDQVYLLSRFQERLSQQVRLAVPPFSAIERVQSKAAFFRLLAELGLAYPQTEFVADPKELNDWPDYPCYVKLAYGTAGQGVWRIANREEMRRLAPTIGPDSFLGSEILIQQPAHGVFCVVQSVFQHGRLLAAHSYEARAIGVGGSAWARIGADHPSVRQDLAQLGAFLGWHGALHLEYFYDAATHTPRYIDANPRIGETMNATLSGLNLCELLVRVSMDEPLEPLSPGSPGVRSHSLVMGLLALAEQHASRRSLLREWWHGWTGQGMYRDSREEWVRPRDDPWSLLPAIAVGTRLLLRPLAAQSIIQRTVERYALSAGAVRTIREACFRESPRPMSVV